MTWEYVVFGRMNVLWQNMYMIATWFLENGRFSTKYGHESIYFSFENRKKMVSYWLFCIVVMTELTFFGPKKIRMPLFSYLSRNNKCSHPIFCQKNIHSLKNTMLLFPHFVKETSILSKTRCSHILFFQYKSGKNPCCHVHIWYMIDFFGKRCSSFFNF